MLAALPGGGGDISFAFQKPLRRCETQPGADERRKETATPLRIEKKRPPGEVESVRGKVDDCGSVVDDD